MNDTVTVRYIVDNVDEALEFYTSHLGFTVENRPAPVFVILARGLPSTPPERAGGPRWSRTSDA